MSSVVEEYTKGKGVAYKDMHTLYEAEQKRADHLFRGEAAWELGNEEDSDWVGKQLKKASTPRTGTPSKSKDKGSAAVYLLGLMESRHSSQRRLADACLREN